MQSWAGSSYLKLWQSKTKEPELSSGLCAPNASKHFILCSCFEFLEEVFSHLLLLVCRIPLES